MIRRCEYLLSGRVHVAKSPVAVLHDEWIGDALEDPSRKPLRGFSLSGSLGQLLRRKLELFLHRLRFLELLRKLDTLLIEPACELRVFSSGSGCLRSRLVEERNRPARQRNDEEKRDECRNFVRVADAETRWLDEEIIDEEHGTD